MKRLFTVLGLTLLGLTAANCNKDDGNNGNTVVNLRDRKEVRDENEKQIEDFLTNNYLIIEGNDVRFDSITSPEKPADAVAIKDDTRITLAQQTITSDVYEYEAYRSPNGSTSLKFTKPKDELEYKVTYFLVPDASGAHQEGNGEPITTIDSVFVKTKAYSLKNESFDNNGPIGKYYSFPITIKEFAYMSQGNYALIPTQLKTAERQILTKVKTATGIKLESNGVPSYDEGSAGRIVAIIPSGLGYFNAGYGSKLKAYQPHIIDMTLIAKRERDHDQDGILSKYETKQVMDKSSELERALTDQEILDLQLSIKDFYDFDTDEDGIPNFLDEDDDGDGILTKMELQYKDDNRKNVYYEYYDPILKTCTNLFRYLDKSCFPDQKDGELVWPKK